MADETGYAQGAELEQITEAAKEFMARLRAICRQIYGPEVWDAMEVGDRGGALVSIGVQPLLQGAAHDEGVEAAHVFMGLGVGIAAILAPMGDRARQAALVTVGQGIHRSANSVANMDPKGKA